MDDSRVLLRVIRESVQAGGTAVIMPPSRDCLKTVDCVVCGVVLKTGRPGGDLRNQSRVVINAADRGVDEIRGQVQAAPAAQAARQPCGLTIGETGFQRLCRPLMHPRDFRPCLPTVGGRFCCRHHRSGSPADVEKRQMEHAPA